MPGRTPSAVRITDPSGCLDHPEPMPSPRQGAHILLKCPSLPSSPSPQENTFPSTVRAVAWRPPARMTGSGCQAQSVPQSHMGGHFRVARGTNSNSTVLQEMKFKVVPGMT